MLNWAWFGETDDQELSAVAAEVASNLGKSSKAVAVMCFTCYESDGEEEVNKVEEKEEEAEEEVEEVVVPLEKKKKRSSKAASTNRRKPALPKRVAVMQTAAAQLRATGM